MRRLVATATVALASAALAAGAGTAAAAPAPEPCGGVPQITDASGDGHHPNTDVLSAWLSEDSGHLQAVIKARAGAFRPEHDDAEVNGAGFAMLFSVGGEVAYVKANAPPAPDETTFDYGTYTPAGGFVSQGTTTGDVQYSSGAGTVTIDIPEATGAVAGAMLSDPFVLTYDGISEGEPDWVDHAPGGVTPGDTARGADFQRGSCIAIDLQAPDQIVGGGEVTVTGGLLPALPGLTVDLDRVAAETEVSQTTSASDGTFSFSIPVNETTDLRASSGGISSNTLTVVVQSIVTARAKVPKRGRATVTGTTDPALPGKVILLRNGAVKATASERIEGGNYELSLKRKQLKPGGYEVVYVPTGARAERSTSPEFKVRRRGGGR